MEQGLSITVVVLSTELRCHWWSNGFQLILLCEAQNCVVAGGEMAFNYTCCAKHRIALSLVEQRLSITLVVGSTELRCHWWSNGFQLHFLCEAQNCLVTGGATAFNYTCCAKHRIALSLVEQRLSITRVVRSTELPCHWWSNGFKLHLLCETQNCVVSGEATAFNYTCSAKHRIALTLVEQQHSITLVRSTELRCHWWNKRLSITLVRNTELRCHWWSNGFQLHLYEPQNCVVNAGATVFNYPCCAKNRTALLLVEQQHSITLLRSKNCVVTGGTTAFNYTCCAKHRIAFSLVEQRLLITFVGET